MKYAGIGEWLKKQLGPVCTITFSGLEKGADIELPDSAYRFRQWWENDTTSPGRQSRSWLDAGWKVGNVDLDQQLVIFVPL